MAEIKQSILWPFYRYTVLMPEHIQSDTFVWLYLALFVYCNNEANKSPDSYDQQEKDAVKRLIKDKFASVIEDTTLDNIIYNTEQNYILIDTTQQPRKKMLNPEAFKFLDTFESVFSSNANIHYVYQDALTGEVLPYFTDLELGDYRDDNLIRINLNKNVSQPTVNNLKKAYNIYTRAKKNYAFENNIEEIFDFSDPDMEVGFDIENTQDKIFDSEIQKPNIIGDDFNIIYIDDSKLIYNFKMDICIEDNDIFISSSFEKHTENPVFPVWINRRYKEALSICSDLKTIDKELRKNYLLPENIEPKIIDTNIVYKNNVADQLSVCGPHYRLADTVDSSKYPNIIDLKKILIHIDKYFTARTKSYFQQIGECLECLITPLVEHNNIAKRKMKDEYYFKSEIRTICSKLRINSYSLTKGRDIFLQWQNCRVNFKADMADLIICNTNISKCEYIYDKFIEDSFYLYNIRNNNEHYKQSGNNALYENSQIEMLFKVMKVFIDLYK